MKRFLISVLILFFAVQTAFSLAPARNLAGKNSLIVITNDSVKNQTDTINRIFDEINILISDDFDFENVSVKDFNIDFIDALHNAYSQGIPVTIEGPLEYIYANSVLSKALFIEIKEKINSAQGKHICIDLSDCYFISSDSQKNIPLPKNCFANEKDLNWIYLGDMIESSIPENFCFNCSNLKSIFMWNERDFSDGAFEKINNAVVVDSKSNYTTLKKYKEKYTYEDLSDWDYSDLTFIELTDETKADELIIENQTIDNQTIDNQAIDNIYNEENDTVVLKEENQNSEEEIDNQSATVETIEAEKDLIESETVKPPVEESVVIPPVPSHLKPAETGVVWLIDRWGHFQPQKPVQKIDDFGLYDYINNDDFVPVDNDELSSLPKLNELFSDLEDPDFEALANTIYIDKEIALMYENDNPRNYDPYEIGETFISSYILGTNKYNNYIDFSSESAAQLEISLDPDNSCSLKKYSDIKIYIIKKIDYSSTNTSLVFCVEGDVNGEHVKDVCLLKMKRYDDLWSVLNIYDGWLNYYTSKLDFNK